MKKLEWFVEDLRSGVVVGIDEVNYSPSLAGDCVVTALWLPVTVDSIRGINDSKKLNPQTRLYLFGEICKRAVYSMVTASVSDIREFGIFRARNIAATSAIMGLNLRLQSKGIGAITTVLCDSGMGYEPCTGLDGIRFVVARGAGSTSYLVGAASIVAKCYVDALFEGYETFWPGFELNKNHGGGSIPHVNEIRRRGTSPVHRTDNYGSEWWEKIHGAAASEPA